MKPESRSMLPPHFPRYALLAIAILFGIASIAARAEEAPDVTVKRVVEEVTAAINADKAVQAGNRAKITALVDAKIVPHVDVEKMTQAAVGPNWSKATPEQKQQLMREFKLLVTNTYSGAFTGYRPTPRSTTSRCAWARAIRPRLVRSVVTGSSGDQIPIDYYLEKTRRRMEGGRLFGPQRAPGRALQGPVQQRDQRRRHRRPDQNPDGEKPLQRRGQRQIVSYPGAGPSAASPRPGARRASA